MKNYFTNNITDIYSLEALITGRMMSEKDSYSRIETSNDSATDALEVMSKCLECFMNRENFIADVDLDGKISSFLSVDFENGTYAVNVYNSHGYSTDRIFSRISGGNYES